MDGRYAIQVAGGKREHSHSYVVIKPKEPLSGAVSLDG